MIRLILSFAFLFSHTATAAIAAGTVWEVRTTATSGNVNGGGFNPTNSSPGTDYSLQDGSQYGASNLLTANGTSNPCTVSSATHTFTSADRGNIMYISSGINWVAGRYEIVSISGSNAVLDRACAGVASAGSGVYVVGGAFSLGSTDDNVFEVMTAGNKMWVKSGTYTIGGVVSISGGGSTTNPVKIEGYSSTRGDAPTGSSRPIFDTGSNNFTSGPNMEWSYIQLTGSGTTGFNLGASNKVLFSKFMNTGTSAGNGAITANANTTNSMVYGSEAWSIRGKAFNGASTNNVVTLVGNYFHDSDICVLDGTTTATSTYVNNIIEGCVTYGMQWTGTKTGVSFVHGNTIYGSENKDRGTAVSIATGSTNAARMSNNIVYGWTTGVSSVDSLIKIFYLDFNNFYNNTTDVSNVTLGANVTTTNPSFQGVSQIALTTATTSNTGNTLTKTGATFVTSGVTAGRDFVYISSTSGTVGIYTISSVDSETQLTLGQAPGNSTGNVTASITLGHNFAVGTNPRAVGFPGVFPAALTTSYVDMGAVQRLENYPAASNVKTGIVYGNSSLTGTYQPTYTYTFQ